MIIVTGGSGFIGGALVRRLTEAGRSVVVVDPVDPGGRPGTGAAVEWWTPDDLLARAGRGGGWGPVEAVLHQGAISSTTEDDEQLLRRMNDGFSTELLGACRAAGVPLVYASSAAVYGDVTDGVEEPGTERPLNPYARSKARFDAVVRADLGTPGSPVVGLRYFNVYGPDEAHKGPMASLVLQLWHQLEATGQARLFGEGEGCGPGEHRRDFVWVRDVVDVVLWAAGGHAPSGIYDCGTGVSRTFGDLARAVIAGVGHGEIVFVPFPDSLRGRYQSRTQADVTRLTLAGAPVPGTDLEDGVAQYVAHLAAAGAG